MKITRTRRGMFTHVRREAETPEDVEELFAGNGVDHALEYSRELAQAVLKRERIFDWKRNLIRRDDLDPATALALDVMFHAEALDNFRARGETESALVEAIRLGNTWGRLAASVRWDSRNRVQPAREAITDEVRKRRDMLAAYIGTHGPRPEKRPGAWYDGFREAHPEHARHDKTLNSDYPHALAISRKRT